MKIISTVQATKKSVTADKGSISTPIEKILSPNASQPTEDVIGFSPKCSAPMAAINTIMPSSQESAAVPTPTIWLMALLRRVNNRIRKKANSGGSGISQVSVAIVIESRLPLHQIDFVGSHRLAAAINRDHQRQAHGNFGRGNGKHHHRKGLAAHAIRRQVAPECHQVNVDRIQHQLHP